MIVNSQPFRLVPALLELVLLVERQNDCVLHEIVGGFALAAHETRESPKIGQQRNDVVLQH